MTTTFRMANVELDEYEKAGGKKMLAQRMAVTSMPLPRKEGSAHAMNIPKCISTVAVKVIRRAPAHERRVHVGANPRGFHFSLRRAHPRPPSATHDAHASCRSMAQTMSMGTAAGFGSILEVPEKTAMTGKGDWKSTVKSHEFH